VSIMFPSIIRLLQAMGVMFASTVMILQSNDIIELVKDYRNVIEKLEQSD